MKKIPRNYHLEPEKIQQLTEIRELLHVNTEIATLKLVIGYAHKVVTEKAKGHKIIVEDENGHQEILDFFGV